MEIKPALDLNNVGPQWVPPNYTAEILRFAILQCSTLETNSAAALAFADNGIPIYPKKTSGKKGPEYLPEFGFATKPMRDANGNPIIDPETKRPKPIPRTGDFYTSTTDRNRVAGAWGKKPNSRIGIALAESTICIDLDRHTTEEDGVATFQALLSQLGLSGLKTLATGTPNNGVHLYFTLPAGCKLKNKLFNGLAGVEVKIYAVTEGKEYPLLDDSPIIEMPMALYNELSARQNSNNCSKPVQKKETKTYVSSQPNTAYANATIQNLANEWSQCDKGGRTLQLNDNALRAYRVAMAGNIAYSEVERLFHIAAESNGYLQDPDDGETHFRAVMANALVGAENYGPADIPQQTFKTQHSAPWQQQQQNASVTVPDTQYFNPQNGPEISICKDIPDLTNIIDPELKFALEDIAYKASTGIQVAFAAFLSSMASALGGRAQIKMFASNPQYLNLYATLEASSGNSKSTAQNVCFHLPFKELKQSETKYSQEKKKYDAMIEDYNLLSDEEKKEKKKKRPTKPHKEKTDIIRGNFTLEGAIRKCSQNPCGISVIVDEMSELFNGLDAYSKNGSGQSKSFLLSAYEGHTYSNARKKEEDELSASCCILSIFGNITPENLVNLYTLNDLFTGFLARFIFIKYERTEAKEGNIESFEPETIELIDLIYKYVKLNFPSVTYEDTGDPKPRTININDDARALFLEKYNFEQRKAFEKKLPSGPVDKLSVQVSKIIALIHIANAAARKDAIIKPITKEEVENCLPLWDWLYSNFTSVVKRLFAKQMSGKLLQLNEKDKTVLFVLVKRIAVNLQQDLILAASQVADWMKEEGVDIKPNAVAFSLGKLLEENETITAKSKGHSSKQYKFSSATMSRLNGLAITISSEE